MGILYRIFATFLKLVQKLKKKKLKKKTTQPNMKFLFTNFSIKILPNGIKLFIF